MHFARPMPFVRFVPPYFPHALTLVYITGIAEIIGAVGLLVPRSRRLAGGGLIIVLFAVFPANINMALHLEQFRDIATGAFFWLRLPLQLVYIAWTAWCGDLVTRAAGPAPKNGRSRVVAIPDFAIEPLRNHLERALWKSSKLALTNPWTGQPWHPPRFSSAFDRAVRSR